MTYSTKQLENMCKIIEGFSKEEHIEILKIINANDNSTLSENNNGTFVRMEDLTPNTIQLIDSRIEYVLKQHNEIDVIEKEKDKLKTNINITCKD
jgi:hypothetical protein